MKVTALIENRPSKTDSRLVAEWGLSLHISFNGHGILFDAGASGAFAKNAAILSVNVASIDAAVLSHHHSDHGGRLRRFLEINAITPVFQGAPPNGDCYFKPFGFVRKYVGLDKALATDYPDRFETIRETTEILPDVFLVPHIDCSRPKPAGNKHLFLKRNQTFDFDDFAHEIVMVIKDKGKLVVLTGCSHNGILNMVDTVARAFAGTPIKAVIGGFHCIAIPPFKTMAESLRDVNDIARLMLDYPVEAIYTGHCTGTKAFGVLKSEMGARIVDVQTGSWFEV